MTLAEEDALVEEFRGGRAPGGGFSHARHVQVARHYILRHGLLGALGRFDRDLRRFAERQGKPELYHATITWAYLLLIHQRLQGRPAHEDWEGFARDNADLLDWKDSILLRYYRRERLFGGDARRVFLFPDAAHGADPPGA